MEIDRARVPLHEPTDGGHVIEVGVRQENRLGNRAPGIERTRDPGRFCTGVDDDHRTVISVRPEDVAVRLESAYRQCENIQPADLAGGNQTEKEVPQPQEPVAFGFSNVKPDPLKLLW